ncbi:hypothetical protein LTR95_006251 [Oleoguttula sp. CCFEE 5521]
MDTATPDSLTALREKYRRPETQDQGNKWYYPQDDWERLLVAATVPEDAPSARKRVGMFSRAGRLMETPYGVPTEESERCKPCRVANGECRKSADQRSKRCGRCWVSNEQCHADTVPDSAPRRRATTNGPRQTRKRRENFKRNHLTSQGTGPRKERVEADAKGSNGTATSTPIPGQAARIEDSLVPDAPFDGRDSEAKAEGLASVSTISDTPSDSALATHDVASLRAGSSESQATLDAEKCFKTEGADRKDLPIPGLQPRSVALGSGSSRLSFKRRYEANDGNEEIEVLEAEAIAKRMALEVRAFTAQSEAKLKRARLELKRRGGIPAIDLTDD